MKRVVEDGCVCTKEVAVVIEGGGWCGHWPVGGARR